VSLKRKLELSAESFAAYVYVWLTATRRLLRFEGFEPAEIKGPGRLEVFTKPSV